jgi:hypothetical protein
VTRVYVDVVERGKALVTLPNGGARIGREGGRYWVDVSEWDEHEELPYKSGLASCKAAAKWVARAMGHTGELAIEIKHEWKGQA